MKYKMMLPTVAQKEIWSPNQIVKHLFCGAADASGPHGCAAIRFLGNKSVPSDNAMHPSWELSEYPMSKELPEPCGDRSEEMVLETQRMLDSLPHRRPKFPQSWQLSAPSSDGSHGAGWGSGRQGSSYKRDTSGGSRGRYSSHQRDQPSSSKWHSRTSSTPGDSSGRGGSQKRQQSEGRSDSMSSHGSKRPAL